MTGTDRPDDATTAAYTDRERAIVAALTRLSVRGPDPDERARAKDRLMLRLAAEFPATTAAPSSGAAIAS
ncbi:hypothetical protein SAMN05443637_101233 [Pseudonocardia thermophila]|jgi:hypothetical protein|uniref:Uncharacterized protein n=1 Tax=Pseudonocardia thermophila TaxID=1848 RepID=A0A1M6NGA7_PSETH|nr:hypothetical protein [Pseudonocardia thermophila]SHJ94623.1 hypothetical protein SAMN05443637_101233 [Pseudonocardia thermophila]